MKIVLEVINKPSEGDILIYTEKGYKNVPSQTFLYELNKNIKTLEKRLSEYEETIKKQEKEIKILKGEEVYE